MLCLLAFLAITVQYDRTNPQLRFAAEEIASAAASAKVPAARIVLATGLPKPPQSYAIRLQGSTYTVQGADPTGAMYGGLDVAEAIRLGTLPALAGIERTPHIARRGIKFNIPLDVRTPSYSDSGDAAQRNIPEMWNMAFWREFLDDMARHRYNVLSLWNLHPFPSLVKVPEYPDIALNDVQRTTLKLDDTFSFTGTDMVRPEMLRKVETVRRITIDQKIKFWRDVMQYAHNRGIQVYLFTWNIFVWGAEGKHGITFAQDNPVTIDYFRKSVRETVIAYPLLAGIGITAGERMENRRDEFSKENWLWKTYGEGIRDALKQQPGREFRLIHRAHQTALAPLVDAWKQYPGPFDISYKYSVAHMYSYPAPIFARKTLEEMPPTLRTWMTVRNDDYYHFRWGDPDYARAYIRNLPGPDKLAGFYMGPDGTVWGRDAAGELVIKKHWYSFMLWGRLSFDPTLPDSLFERTLGGRKRFDASNEASRIVPLVTRFFWGDIDLKWYPEACLSHPRHRGFYTVKHFMQGESMPGAGVQSIPDFIAGRGAGMTPPQVAEELKAHAAATLKLAIAEYEPMAHLGNYYAEKILGATALAQGQKDAAIRHLEAALEHWKKYAATAQYPPQLLNRVGYVDLNALTAKVREDIEIARKF